MTLAAGTSPTPPTPLRPRPRRGFRRLFYWATILALVVFNAWWPARDYWPLPELKTVADWIRQKRYNEAEAALREHLRRSPHNGEAIIMLAGARAARGDDLGAAGYLHSVPFWWPNKLDMLLLEGQLDLASHQTRAAEAAWLQCVKDDPLHPPPPQSRTVAQATLELLRLYGQEGRVEEARALTWRIYERVNRADQQAVLRHLTELLIVQSAQDTEASQQLAPVRARIRATLHEDVQTTAAIRRLAKDCEELGWKREAEAWASFAPRP